MAKEVDGLSRASPVDASAQQPHEDVQRQGVAGNMHYAAPATMSGFWQSSPTGRGELIAACQGDAHLETSVITFLKNVLQDRALDETTRNSAANALLFQERIDLDVPPLLLAMLRDEAESIQWRDYVVQHLAVAMGVCPPSSAMTAELTALASNPRDGIGATALLQLHRLDLAGIAPFPAPLGESVRQWVADRALDQRVRMACLSVISERRDARARPVVRALLADPDMMVRRQAVATLGYIGETADKSFLQEAIASQDGILAAIATSALQRLHHEIETSAVPAAQPTTPF